MTKRPGLTILQDNSLPDLRQNGTIERYLTGIIAFLTLFLTSTLFSFRYPAKEHRS